MTQTTHAFAPETPRPDIDEFRKYRNSAKLGLGHTLRSGSRPPTIIANFFIAVRDCSSFFDLHILDKPQQPQPKCLLRKSPAPPLRTFLSALRSAKVSYTRISSRKVRAATANLGTNIEYRRERLRRCPHLRLLQRYLRSRYRSLVRTTRSSQAVLVLKAETDIWKQWSRNHLPCYRWHEGQG